MELESLIRTSASELESGGLIHLVRLPDRKGQSLRPEPPLPGAIRQRLAAIGITGLWSHQALALDAARRGENVIVSTGTASGKSLCFNLPVFERTLKAPETRALYLYPTKALAQDQLRAIRAFGLPQLTAATYDGDTPYDERTSVRRYARIVLSNPDMLHFGILSQHSRWADFFANLAFVVVDEAHVLRGVFGSHVGCILRRLNRVARHYGSDPQFILTSATMANPAELAERLVGKRFTAIEDDGSPKGTRIFAFWNPPFIDPDKGIRASSNWETARLLAGLADGGVRTIAFAKSRKAAELIAKYAKEIATSPEVSSRIRPYRAGYLASERREIEQQLFSGELLGVAATTALELGVDVGGLDAVVMNGFPGTVAAVWQQAGRAGRLGGESVAVLIGGDDPLDQYYITHPDILLSRPFEAALVDVTNPNILRPHLASAAYELPIEEDKVDEVFGEGSSELAQKMIDEGDFVLRASTKTKKGPARYHWKRRTPPGADLDIRSLGGGTYSIVDEDTGALLGTVDAARAFHQIHPGAIYLHQGENFEVGSLDISAQVALVSPARGNYYTQSRDLSDMRILDVHFEKPVGSVEFFLGKVEVTEKVIAFVKKDITTGDTLAIVDLDLPEQVLQTVAFWYTVEPPVVDAAGVTPKDLPGALHAAEHAGIGILPLFAMADRWDIGGLSTALAAQTGLPTVFIYDGYPGGAGIADRGFAKAEEHLTATLETVRTCKCESGCPSCIQSPKCGNGNEPLEKAAAIQLMSAILSGGRH